MAYTEKSLNTEHLDRPAVVLFKKPLATNDEMSFELEKLIGDAFPIQRYSAKDYPSSGIPKAVFFRPIDPTKQAVNVIYYNQNAIFTTSKCTDKQEKINTRFGNYDIEGNKYAVLYFLDSVPIAYNSYVNFLSKAYDYGYALGEKISKWLGWSTEYKTLYGVQNNIFKAYFRYLKENKLPTPNADIADYQKKSEEYDKLRRTWYVFSFDSDYYVPKLKYDVVENINTKGGKVATTGTVRAAAREDYAITSTGTPTLNTTIVYSTEELTLEQFRKDFQGQLYPDHKELENYLNKYKVTGVYKVIFQEDVDYGTLYNVTYKEISDMYGKIMKQNKKYTSIYNTLADISSFFLNNYSVRDWELSGYDYSKYGVSNKNFKPIVDSMPSVVSKYKDTDLYKIDVMEFLRGVPVQIGGKNKKIQQDIIQSDIKPGFSGKFQLPSKYLRLNGYYKGYYSSISDYEQDSIFYYADDSGSYMVFDKTRRLVDVVQVYLNTASYLNDLLNASSIDEDRKILSQYVNCEAPLRYSKQKTTSGGKVIISSYSPDSTEINAGYIESPGVRKVSASDYSSYQDDSDKLKDLYITPLRLNTILQTQALFDSYNRGRIGNRVVEETFYESRKSGGYNVKLIDFKIMYYMMIKYNVVLPKYNKLEPEFIHGNNESSTVRMFPVNFFTATGSIEAGGDEVTFYDLDTQTNKINYTFDDIAKLDLNSKKKLVDMYEQVYFGGWSGFYYTNSTGYLEDVARYTNTSISDTVLTTVQEFLSTQNENNYIKNYTNPDIGMTALREAFLTELNSVKNTDVSSITVSRQTMGKSQSTILIKNTDRKYNFKEGIFKGNCIFEPMDEVSIYLPTYSGGITMAFTGLISSVDAICSNGYNTLALQCDCPLKMLEINRTNIKPAAASTAWERNYSTQTVFEVPNDMLTSVENWSTWMMAQSLSYFTSMLGNIKNPESTLVYTNEKLFSSGDFTVYYPKFNDPLLQYLWSRKSSHHKDNAKAQESLKELVNLYTDTIVYKHGEPVRDYTESSGITNLTSIYTYNSKSNKKDYKKVEYKIYAQRSDSYISELGQRKCVAQITGTLQPAFALGTKAIPLLFSEYKTNMDILLETAEKFNFFLYSNRHGIVRFSPPMVSLTNLNISDGLLSQNKRDKENDYSYDMSSPYIFSNQNTISFRESQDDSKLVNYIQISGGFVEAPSIDAANVGYGGTVANWPLIKKYGYHAGKKQSILGIANKPAIEAYALSLMDRYNKNFISAQCEAMGSGDFDINTTVYSSINNTVYLLAGLSSQYEAGKTFTTSATLNWGRKPLCPFTNIPIQSYSVDGLVDHIVSTTLNPNVPSSPTVRTDAPGVKLPEFESTLNSLFEKNLITNAYYRQVKGILTALKNNSDYEQLLYSFIFNGYFWDGVPSISFEDLSTEFYSENIANGLEYPIFGSGKDDIANGAINLQKSVNNTKKSIKKNTTGVFLSLLDQSDPSKLQDTYVSD